MLLQFLERLSRSSKDHASMAFLGKSIARIIFYLNRSKILNEDICKLELRHNPVGCWLLTEWFL